MGIGNFKEGPTILATDGGKYRIYFDAFTEPAVHYLDFADSSFSSNGGSQTLVSPFPWRHCDVIRTNDVNIMRTVIVAQLASQGSGAGLKGSVAPSNPTPGTQYFDTSDNHQKVWNGSTWKQMDN
jgi:hypothetical protein